MAKAKIIKLQFVSPADLQIRHVTAGVREAMPPNENLAWLCPLNRSIILKIYITQ